MGMVTEKQKIGGVLSLYGEGHTLGTHHLKQEAWYSGHDYHNALCYLEYLWIMQG